MSKCETCIEPKLCPARWRPATPSIGLQEAAIGNFGPKICYLMHSVLGLYFLACLA